MSSWVNGRLVLTPEEEAALRRAREERLRKEAEKRRIEEERKAEMRRRKKLRSEIGALKNEYTVSAAIFDLSTVYSTELKNRTGTDNGWDVKLKKFVDTQNKMKKLFDEIKADDDSNTLSNVKEKVNRLASESVIIQRELQQISAANKEALDAGIASDINDAFKSHLSFDFKTEKEKQKEKAKELDNKIAKDNFERLFKLKELNLSKDLEEKISHTISVLGDIKCDAKSYQAIAVIPLEKECRAYIEEIEKLEKEYERLIPEYLVLCEEIGQKPEPFTATKVGIELLKKEIEKLRILSKMSDENEYISECIDRVMAEMGYPIIGHKEVTKKSGKHFSSGLYNFDDGSAVNVMISQNGDITMEIGGMDTVDRAPSEYEADKLCPSMEHFCSQREEIERRLAEKGIVKADTMKVLPPTKEYVQIFNTSEYETIETTCTEDNKRRQKSAKKESYMRLN